MDIFVNMKNTYHISHLKFDSNKGWLFQSNEEHQKGVAELASQFAGEFNMAEWGRVLGLLHDKGKEQKTFQQHILKESGCKPDIIVEGDYKHAYVGALVAKEMFNKPPYYQLVDNIIMGHHRGLYDDGDKKEILKKSIPSDVTLPSLDANLTLPNISKKHDLHTVIRMLYSCLVDADRLDTERFMLPEQYKQRGRKSSMSDLLSLLNEHLQYLKSISSDTEVNNIRNEVQQYCIKESENNIDFYSLTVPTGGGKTLSSVLWALRHAVKNNLQRVIIAIPYTSIIVQTAAVLKNIFGVENVLEHHSDINENDADEDYTKTQRLATENWDYPIIVTTNVRLFESLFSNKASDCRKIHNIANSVLILDEVQALPIDFLQPIVNVLDTLKRLFRVSVLFTTASQPILSGEIKGTLDCFEALPNIHEIIPNEANLHNRLRRVKLDINDTPQSYDDIANKLTQHNRVLCIVNTRNDAKEIFSRLPKEGITLHLSRMMCPKHVRTTIERIKAALKDDSETVIRVVSTQLIEAGVDIDFPVVFRQSAGLDSILQAAGRCNREGKLDICTTYVFALQKPLPRGLITQANNARLNTTNVDDWFSPSAMTMYFKNLYSRQENFDKKDISKDLYCNELNFETASNKFRLIDEKTTSVIVNWENSLNLVEQLKTYGISYSLMKEFYQYSVNVRENDLRKLLEAGVIEMIDNCDNIFVVSYSQNYDELIGLKTDNYWLEETFIQ